MSICWMSFCWMSFYWMSFYWMSFYWMSFYWMSFYWMSFYWLSFYWMSFCWLSFYWMSFYWMSFYWMSSCRMPFCWMPCFTFYPNPLSNSWSYSSGRCFLISTQIRLKKYLPVTNALAYSAVASPTPTKRCTTSTSARPLERQFRHVDAAQTAKARQICTHRAGANVIKLFCPEFVNFLIS
jgi:hypothetical protein